MKMPSVNDNKPKVSKILIAAVIIGIAGATVWMHWETIQDKLMPDYGTDPYTMDGATCKK